MMQSLSTYIQHPEQLSVEVVDELYELVERNPSFQTARLLLVRGLYQLQDERFGAELRKAALLIPDRNALFHLLEDDKLQPTAFVPVQASRQHSSSSASDRTQSLIENFLEQLPETSKTRKSHSVSPSVDYMSYLMQQPNAEDLPDAEPENEVDSEEDFQEVPVAVPVSSENAKEMVNDPYFTETLAHIYIKQGKYTKAIEIIRRLSLNYPKKNRYFADQIRFLEKLIINERYQNNENN